MTEKPDPATAEILRAAQEAIDGVPRPPMPEGPTLRNWRPEMLKRLVDGCPYMTRLAITAQVFEAIVAHGNDPGSFRHLIYDRLGFQGDAYQPLYEAGGMLITNHFELSGRDKP